MIKRKFPTRLRRFLTGDDIRKIAKKKNVGERLVQLVLKGDAPDKRGIYPLALNRAEQNKAEIEAMEKVYQEKISQF